MPDLVAGDIVVEVVLAFALSAGSSISSVGKLDFPVIEAIPLVYSISFAGILLVVDALFRLIDPRSEAA